MPIGDRIEVRVYCRDAEERDQAAEILSRVDPDATQVYDRSVEGWATPDALSELQRRRLVIEFLRPRGLPAAARATPSASTEEGPGPGKGLASRTLQEAHRRLAATLDAGASRLREQAQAYLASLGDASGATLMSAGALEPGEDEQPYEVTLRIPVRPEWRKILSDVGGEICASVPPSAYRIFLTPAQLAAVEKLPFVERVEPYGIEKTVTDSLLQALGLVESAAGSSSPEPVAVQAEAGAGAPALLEAEEGAAPMADPGLEAFDLVVHRERDRARIKAAIEAMSGTTIDESPTLIRFRLRADPRLLGALADRPEVKYLSPYRTKSLFSDWARRNVGVEVLERAPASLTGEGELVAVFDSGIDLTHPDLEGRVKDARAYELVTADGTRSGTQDDLVGHGTHVCGIIAGTGKASAGKVRGVAPGAQLISVGIVAAGPSGRPELLLPADLARLLRLAVEAGAWIVNLSWGDAGGEVRWDDQRLDLTRRGAYSPLSYQLDKFVYDNPEVLVVVAAGNEGAAPRGYHEYNTICSPATAKNCLTVGACGSGRPGIERTYQSYNERKFRVPVGALAMNSPEIAAALSSRGPTDADSVKPDVTACGVYVLSARARNAAMTFWAPAYSEFDGRYAYLGGTSMAAPVVSGAAAIVRQFLRTRAGCPRPSAALLKAILIAATERPRPLTPEQGAHPRDAEVGYPDFHQGFGRVNLASVLPHDDAADRKLLWADVPSSSSRALRSHGHDRGQGVHRVTVPEAPAGTAGEASLRVVLTWTDPPGQHLQNNLNLFINGPADSLHVGNSEFTYLRDPIHDGNSMAGVPFDRRNNVLQITLPAARPGPYTIRVIAQNTIYPIEDPAQGYALCVCGRVVEDRI